MPNAASVRKVEMQSPEPGVGITRHGAGLEVFHLPQTRRANPHFANDMRQHRSSKRCKKDTRFALRAGASEV
jgi:hypothetical protein